MAYTNMLGDAQEAVATRHGPQYVAHYTLGVHEFTVERLGPDSPAILSTLDEVGAGVVSWVGESEGTLLFAETGSLIRTVLRTPTSALICDLVFPSKYLVGYVTFEEPGQADRILIEADRAIAALANGIRRRSSRQSLNHGGFESSDLPDQITSFDEPTDPHVAVAGSHPFQNNWVQALNRGDLHYVAYLTGGQLLFAADLLDDGWVATLVPGIDAERLRNFYAEFCRILPDLLSGVNRTAYPATLDRLTEVVLDVEQGALYAYRLTPDEYLLGVTIDQRRVQAAHRRMAALARLHQRS